MATGIWYFIERSQYGYFNNFWGLKYYGVLTNRLALENLVYNTYFCGSVTRSEAIYCSLNH